MDIKNENNMSSTVRVVRFLQLTQLLKTISNGGQIEIHLQFIDLHNIAKDPKLQYNVIQFFSDKRFFRQLINIIS